MAAWAGLESRAMAEAERPSYQGSQRRTPSRSARQAGGLCPWGLQLWLGSPHRASGAAVQHVAKRWQHYTASGQRYSRAAGGAHQQGVCVRQGLGRGLVLCPPGLPVGTTALAGPHGRCGSCGLDPERQEDHCILEASALASIPELFAKPPG